MQNTSQPSASFIAHMKAERERICNVVNARVKSASAAFDMVYKYDKNSMYTLKKMASTNDDYVLIKKYFEATILGAPEAQISKIYRVTKRGIGVRREQKSDNIMLFHGTSSRNGIGIVEQGFKPSVLGKYGPGVYLTEFSSCAESFAREKNIDHIKQKTDKRNELEFIFVNEILESEKLEEIVVEERVIGKTASPRKNQFEKYIRSGTADPDATEERDTKGRRIRISEMSEAVLYDYHVCHENLVIPRYLIQCFPIYK